jgi:hypothetical protein
VAIYIGALLFGGVLILASVFGAGEHAVDVHSSDVSDPHAEGSGHVLLAALFGIRFWSFGAAFFGLTGLLLRVLGAPALAAPVGAVVGAAAGFAASLLFRKMTREAVGSVGDAGALVGREGRLLLPVTSAQQGKVRIAQPGGGHVDLIAALNGSDETLAVGAEVIVVDVRGTVAVVTRSPSARS